MTYGGKCCRMARSVFIPGLLFTFIFHAPGAMAQDVLPSYSLSGSDLVITLQGAEPGRVALGCMGSKLLQHGQRLYVACGARGVVILSLKDAKLPALVSRRSVDGVAMGFFVQEGQVWVKIARLEARPLGAAVAGAAPVEPTPAPGSDPEEPGAVGHPRPGVAPKKAPTRRPTGQKIATRAVQRTGRVIKVGLGEVVISLGSRDGLRRDDHIELFVRHKVKMGGGEAGSREEVLVVGEVTVVSDTRAKVRLGMNERVPKGSGARRSPRKLTESIVAPPRVGGVWEIKANLRPLIPLDTLGFGLIIDSSLGYRFKAPMVLRLVIAPLAFAATGDESPAAFSGHLMAGLDLRLFELGFGLGVSTVNEERDVSAALTITQGVRLGALDGLHLEVHNTLLYFDGDFNYGGTVGAFQIPLASRWWLLFRGGGGIVGYAFGEGGLRIRLKGNGHHKSIFLSATIGWGMVSKRYEGTVATGGSPYPTYDSATYNGPTAGLGIEWRP